MQTNILNVYIIYHRNVIFEINLKSRFCVLNTVIIQKTSVRNQKVTIIYRSNRLLLFLYPDDAVHQFLSRINISN